ncbi:hypothetical protein [Rhizorhabdus phycosphaerae]|uniref:hypothetical protein n=1 Tax=Rhizorhabdus phycosphaerae TaxID=2711156 RepID=UPI0013EA56FE|nr:hypothetical protein [Rhizorhabdus phycosphaerae]
MRAIGYLVIAAIAIALLQRVLAVLLIALCALLLWGVFFRPAETFGLLCIGLLSSLLERNPWAGAAILALLCLLVKMLPDHDSAD